MDNKQNKEPYFVKVEDNDSRYIESESKSFSIFEEAKEYYIMENNRKDRIVYFYVRSEEKL
jgi:hypothetical protein